MMNKNRRHWNHGPRHKVFIGTEIWFGGKASLGSSFG
jgi:hypothetical protein